MVPILCFIFIFHVMSVSSIQLNLQFSCYFFMLNLNVFWKRNIFLFGPHFDSWTEYIVIWKNNPLCICLLIKLSKVCYLSSTVILVNCVHYYNPKRGFKMPALLLTSSLCHSHSIQRKGNKKQKQFQTHTHGVHIVHILMCWCPRQLINSLDKWILVFICLHVMSGCGVHYPSAILDWLLTAASFIMHVRNKLPET